MHLTENEKRVLLATDHRPLDVLAHDLGMTERNCKYFSDQLRAKLGVRYRWELVDKRRQLEAEGLL